MGLRALRIELVDDLGVLTGKPASQHLKLLRDSAYLGRNSEPSMLSEFSLLVTTPTRRSSRKRGAPRASTTLPISCSGKSPSTSSRSSPPSSTATASSPDSRTAARPPAATASRLTRRSSLTGSPPRAARTRMAGTTASAFTLALRPSQLAPSRGTRRTSTRPRSGRSRRRAWLQLCLSLPAGQARPSGGARWKEVGMGLMGRV
mmetsp:Transcript_43729/g.93035  ORF Transcript_43729/g.93035 Transcript_43729/m.93035 type:complete len:204 (+) Transcript_43729:252-863(+)